jgi:histidinol-phosphatase (PHP family)
MNLYDQHLHSHHSFDSQADPRDNVLRAIEVGLSGLSFTEHYDTHPDERDGCVYDDARYSSTIDELRREFEGSIRIGKGVEICYQPDNMAEIVDFLDTHTFDVVILSVHWCYGQPIHERRVWEGQDPSRVTRRYLEAVRDAVAHVERLQRGRSRLFDILGHLDFCKRYSMRFAECNCVGDHFDVIEGILTGCLAADIVPEVNTSTLRQGLTEAMPGPGVVRRYAELGGTMMSLGSDSHRACDIGADFDRAIATLRAAGIANVPVFESRNRRVEAIA